MTVTRVILWLAPMCIVLPTTRKFRDNSFICLVWNTSAGTSHTVGLSGRRNGRTALCKAEGIELGFLRHLKPTGPLSWFLKWGLAGLFGLSGYTSASPLKWEALLSTGDSAVSLERGLDLQGKV